MEKRSLVEIKTIFPKTLGVFNLGHSKDELENIIKKLNKLDTSNAKATQKNNEDYSNYLHVSFDKYILNKMPKLKKKVMNCFNQYKEIYKYINDFQMTTSWISKTSKGQSSFPHNHRNCMYSGVYYPKIDSKSAAIYFDDFTDNRFRLGVKEWNEYNAKEICFRPKSDTLLIFPSELYHIVGTHNSDMIRYCIAMNFIPVGKLGDADSFVNLQVKN